MKVIKLRVVPDTEEDIFRDIQIGVDHTFEELYRSIVNAFSFRGDQLASFYLSNEEWDKGHEIALMDMGGKDGDIPGVMSEAILGEIVTEVEQKVILVYDFLKMWCFYIEVLAIEDEDDDGTPKVLMAFGEAPKEDEKELPDLFEGIEMEEDNSGSEDYESYGDYSEDDDDDFDPGEFENIDDLDI